MARRNSCSGDDSSSSCAPGSATNTGNSPSSTDKPSPNQPCLIIAIGASAGGQAALEQLFTAMPADCNISFVVVMHLPPDGPSFLSEMLGRYTMLDVLTAEEGMELNANTVHVIPAGRVLTVSDSLLRLEDVTEPRGTHHPVDCLFRSLAVDAKERVVAVVLSGFGTDGAEGVKAVKEKGGIVIVQEPGSAVSPAMPKNAIATGTADFILPAEEIAGKIADIARGSCSLPAQSCAVTTFDEELAAIFKVVKSKTGHDYSSYKRSTIVRRIERRMAVNEVAGMKKYIDLLETNEQEAHALGQEILIGVTSFFRDPDAFEVLRNEIIPRLFAGRDPSDPVRIWHACCSSGEEVYSTAILIREYLNEQRINATVQFFATDIDEAAICQARAGVYDDIEEDVGEERLKSFFTRVNGRWQVAKQLREMIVFAHHSVIKDPPFSRLDLLVCRNFLIYLNPDMQKRLISLFHLVLKPRSILFLGASETVGRQSELFTPMDKKWKIFERLESVRRDETIFPFTASVRRFPGNHRTPRPVAADEPNGGAVAEKILMERYAPPCVVVNEKYEVVHVSTRASRLLEVPVGEPTRDILKMTREELRPSLRAAIYKTFSEQKQVSFRGVKVVLDNEETAINVLVEPLPVTSAEKLAMVILEPAPAAPLAEAAGGDKGVSGLDSSKDALIRQLEEQLHLTHEQLHATAEQLETSQEGFMSANEELMSINEEFQSANEELQSTNEELETSKEELQALNEELVTVNAELHGKVEELDQANNDMENLLTSSGIATLFLDRQLTIKRFTPAMAQILNLIPADVGRPFRHLAGTIDWSGLSGDAATVLEKLAPIEREVSTVEDGRCFLMRVLPYRTAEGRVDGIVVTLIDITERKKMEERTAHLASFPQLNPNPILELDLNGEVIFVNPATEKVLQILGAGKEGAAAFLPPDLDEILRNWDRKSEATLYRETDVIGRTFGESIFLTPKFDVARIYAFDITERKHMEEAHARLAAIVESSDDAIIAKDLSGTILTWNAGAERMFGYRPAEIVGKPVTLLIPPEQHEEEERTLQRLLAGERIDHYETVRLAMDGRPIDVSVTVSPVKNSDGQIIGASKIVRDITERKRAEEALAESEMRVRRKLESIISPEGDIGNLDLADIIDAPGLQSLMDDFYELTHMPMGLIDLKGKVLVGVGWQDICTKFHRVNPETCQNCVDSDVQLSAGVPHGEYKAYRCKNNLWDVATPVMVGDRQFGNLFMGQFFFDDEPLDYELFRSQAREYGFDEQEYIAALEAVPRMSRETLNTSMHFFMKLADILSKQSYSNLKLARSLAERDGLMESLRESEERFRNMFERHQAVMLLIEPESGAIVDANAAATGFYGHSREKLRGLKIQELNQLSPEEVAAERQRAVKEQRNHFVFPHRIATGEVRWVEVYSTPIESQGMTMLFSIIHDITERKRAEEALHESQKQNEFLAHILEVASQPFAVGYPDGSLGLANSAYEQLTGYSGDELRSADWATVLTPPEWREMERQKMEELHRTGLPVRYEKEYVRKDGNVVPVELLVHLSTDTEDAPQYYYAFVTDITARKRAEEMIRRQSAIVQGINQIFEAALSSVTEEELGEACLAVAEEITGSRFGFIGEIGKDGLLHDIALSNPGWELCTMYNQSGERRAPGNFHIHGVYGMVLTENRGFFTNEPAVHPASIGVPAGHPPLTAFLGVPLRTDSRALGMIAVGNREGGYSDEELLALEALAPAIVEAFQRKKAEEQIRRHLEELRENNEELTRFNSASVGRELRMIELKREINELCGRAGEQARYPLDFEEG